MPVMQSVDLRRAIWGLGLCGVLSSLTTVTNILLLRFYPPVTDFDVRVTMLSNGFYMARQWILLVHPFLTLTGALGVALYVFREHPGKSLTGFLFAFTEKITEFFLGMTMLFVVLGIWVRGYGATTDPARKAILRERTEVFFEYRDGAFVLLWVTFTLAAVLYALALRKGGRYERVVALTYAAAAVLTVLMLIGEYAGQNAWVSPIILWTYAPVLTANRLLAGLMLMRRTAGAEA